MPETFQLRRGTTAEWVFANPILQAGEMGYETSTNRIKIGTGVDPWSSLLYVESSADSVDWSNVDNKPAAFAPSTHASTHEAGGVDPITPGGIGAAPTTSPTFTGVITVPTGDPAAPAIVAAGDSNTGLSFATDTLIFSTDGAERLRIDSAGKVGIGTSSPSSMLHGAAPRSDGSIVVAALFSQNVIGNPVLGSGVQLLLGAASNTLRCAGIEAGHESGTNAHYLSLLTSANGAAPAARVRVKSTGVFRFVPLPYDPATGEAGDVYYSSTANKLRVHNGTSWINLH